MKEVYLSLLALMALISGLHSQSPALDLRLSVQGSSTFMLRGVLATLADQNGDGCRDFAAGDPLAAQFGMAAGGVRVYSGQDGALLQTINGSIPSMRMGGAIADAGDVDGDGIHDLLIGFGGPTLAGQLSGSVQIWRGGAVPALLVSVPPVSPGSHLGSSLAGLGDLNGDGVPDFVAGAPNDSQSAAPRGAAFAFSGLNGATIYQFLGLQAGDHLGSSVANAGDVDGDGVNDILIGSRGGGYARLYSGASGGLILHMTGPTPAFGAVVAGIGDVDGDGTPDFLVGSPYDLLPTTPPIMGTASVVSGSTGSVLYVYSGMGFLSAFGGAVSGAGDLDGDGVPDFAIGAPGESPAPLGSPATAPGALYLHSGATGGLLRKIVGQPGDGLGFGMGPMGDVNGDGFDDVLVGGSAGGNGIAQIRSAKAVVSVVVGGGLIPHPYLEWLHGPAGNTHQGLLRVFWNTFMAPAAPGYLALSLAPQNTVLPFGVLGVDLTPGTGIILPFTFNGSGSWTVPVALQLPSLAGTIIYLQASGVASAYGLFLSDNTLQVLL